MHALIFTERYTLPLGEKSYQVKRALYYDASVEYFADQHRNYGRCYISGLVFCNPTFGIFGCLSNMLVSKVSQLSVTKVTKKMVPMEQETTGVSLLASFFFN